MFIRDSRRSYRTYSYPELILITNLCLFGTPVGVTELILKLRSSHLFRDTRGVSRRLRNVYWYCRAYSCLIRNLFLYGNTCKYYKTYTSTSYLILVLRSIFLSYRTYIWVTDTGVPVGTTELILSLPIREYP